ncbi:PIG-L deacetylase family protein [Phytohabitans sp. ZYX-F-186]|uniref:PIG-L deacetylase family protein n=1 Tax=Phytohabitans maris TaxID=3071409 RepID=A0ABU0ZDP5_9ACTN|nr:PIG-L deacetylase family protein [Phytohabitans sp. ZYX-F-186]MDQ7904445.1 PIG-L deacetylase family protein [Phytohabitans sp. ZYX-F-186]
MTVPMSALLLVALLAAATAALGGTRTLRRRFRRPRLIQAAALASAALLVPPNALHAAAGTPGPAAALLLAASLAALSTVAGLAAALRITAPPARLPRRVLAVGAHPDDVELACGGTLLRLVDSGHEVRVLVMSRGGAGGDPATRAREATAGGLFLGVTGVEVLDLPDTRLAAHENEMAAAIEEAIRRYRPDIVFTHSANDQHQDHRAVHAATLRAGRGHPALLCYESPSATADFRPSVFVDIAEHLEAKVGAVAAHRGQRAKPYAREARVRGLAAFRGNQARLRRAEGFEPVRLPLVEES